MTNISSFIVRCKAAIFAYSKEGGSISWYFGRAMNLQIGFGKINF